MTEETGHGTTLIPEDLTDSVSFPAAEAQQRFHLFHNVLQLPLYQAAHAVCLQIMNGHAFGLLVPATEAVEPLYRKGLYALPQAGQEFCTLLWESPLHKTECHVNRYKKIERSIRRKIPSSTKCVYASMHCATYVPVFDEQQFYGLLQLLTMRHQDRPVKLKPSAADVFVTTIRRQAGASLAKLPLADEDRLLPAQQWVLGRLRDDMLYAFAQPLPDTQAGARHRHIRSVLHSLAGASKGMRDLFGFIDHAQQNNKPVLFSGPKGSGKLAAAKVLHELSRPTAPFRALDCAALNTASLTRALFGDEEGDRGAPAPGILESIGQGTVCLRNLERLDASLQERLARYLRTGMLNREHSGRDVAGLARVMATTSDIDRLEETLIEDLIDAFQDSVAEVPPLSDRKEDIPIIVDQELDAARRDYGFTFQTPPDAMLARWRKQRWKDNVAGLRRDIHAYIMEQLPAPPLMPSPELPHEGLEAAIDAIERAHLHSALTRRGYVAEAAGADLGLTRDQVRRRMKKYDIDKPARKKLPEKS